MPFGGYAGVANVAEDRVGEVVAEADGVGGVQFCEEPAAVVGGSGGVVVVDAGPFGVAGLDR